MKQSLVILALGIVFCFGSVQDVKALDGLPGFFLEKICAISTADSGETSAFDMACTMYIGGVVNGYTAAILKAGIKDDLCTPANSHNEQWTLVVKKFFRDNPDRLNELATVLILDALKEEFPCTN